MLYWVIVKQTDNEICAVYLTTSYKKAKKKYDELDKEAEEIRKYDYCNYYISSVRSGGKE